METKPDGEWLAGKVRRWTLPVIPGRPGPDAPPMKRMMLPQGELAQFYNGQEGIRYMAFVELLADSYRGNHYHKVKVEWLYVIEGELVLVVEDIDSGVRDSLPLKTGDLALIQTRVAHLLRIAQPGRAVEFSPAPFDPTDIYPHNLKA